MNLFYVPTTDKNTISNYVNTVVKKITHDNKPIKSLLPKKLKNEFGLWGFKRGSSNDLHYQRINSGDVLLFRTKDAQGYQCFDGIGYVFDKINSTRISKAAWDDSEYENILIINKY